jgi:hypothetical protein
MNGLRAEGSGRVGDRRVGRSGKLVERIGMGECEAGDSKFSRYFRRLACTIDAMDSKGERKLRFLHSESALNRVKLDLFRRLTTGELKASLVPGRQGSLKVRADGTVLDGHHRLSVLVERSEDIDQLPREIMDKEP